MQQNRWGIMGLITLAFIILILLCGGWWFFTGDVETVLSLNELRGGWLLSPGGDKILYTSEEHNVLMLLSTEKKFNLKENCLGYTWLNNTDLVCSSVIIDTKNMIKVPIQDVKASEVNLDMLLMAAGTIYKLEQYNDIVLLGDNYKQNLNKSYWVTEIKNVDQVLQDRSYITVPSVDYNPRPGEKIYSPNQAYYYLYGGDAEGAYITIYDAANGTSLARTSRDGRLYQIGGWAGDSSGVYFQLIPSGIGMFSNRSPLYKLRVR